MIVSDTAPLVAAALYKDPDHHRCVELFTGLRLANRQMLLPAPIVAEVGYLLGVRAGPKTEAAFLRALAEGDFVPVDLTTADYTRMAELVEQYAKLPLGWAPAMPRSSPWLNVSTSTRWLPSTIATSRSSGHATSKR